VSFCEYDIEPSGFKKTVIFLSNYQLSSYYVIELFS